MGKYTVEISDVKGSLQPSVYAHILTETMTELQSVINDPQTEQWPKGVGCDIVVVVFDNIGLQMKAKQLPLPLCSL